MKLVIQLRQANVTPENAQRKCELVWFLVNHAEVFDDRIEFSGPDHCGSVSIIEDNFALPSATLAKYPDVANEYEFLTIHDAANALNWPAHLRIETPDMHDEQPAHETEVDRLTRIIDAINASTAGLVAEIWYGTNVPDAIHIHSTAKRLHFVWGTCNECWGADVFVNDEAWNKSECDGIGIDTTLSSDIYTPDVVAKTIIEATLARMEKGKQSPLVETMINAVRILEGDPEITAEINFTSPPHGGDVEIMAFRAPFKFVFMNPPWCIRVWVAQQRWEESAPCFYMENVTLINATPANIAEACRKYIHAFRIPKEQFISMDAELYNGDNYSSLSECRQGKGFITRIERAGGIGLATYTLLNLKAALDVTGIADDIMIAMRIRLPNDDIVVMPEVCVADAIHAIDKVFTS